MIERSLQRSTEKPECRTPFATVTSFKKQFGSKLDELRLYAGTGKGGTILRLAKACWPRH
ncbi:hypothetical protein AYM39_04400 [Methylomonas sp. DH-1]|nr:hypothetical protein AYM39_04400 [Methylomonas sp. DH-1]